MEHRITHACGHEQAHYIPGYPDQRERKARWLRTTACRHCFVAGKRAAEAGAAATDERTIAGLPLAALAGSERQVAWASTIRARRLAALMKGGVIDPAAGHRCLAVSDAKWWIDHRDAADDELLREAAGPSASAATFSHAA